MLEPLIVLTVLNCVLMFSTTATTCALWWQHQKRCCCAGAAGVSRQKSQGLTRSRSCTFGSVKKPGGPRINDHVDANFVNGSFVKRKDKRSERARKSKRNLQYLAEYRRRREERMSPSGEPEARQVAEKAKTSEASQTVNDRKSTVVMKFSTVQKVVQIVDDDSRISPPRISLKDLVIQKEKRRDRDIEQNLVTNGDNPAVTGKRS